MFLWLVSLPGSYRAHGESSVAATNQAGGPGNSLPIPGHNVRVDWHKEAVRLDAQF